MLPPPLTSETGPARCLNPEMRSPHAGAFVFFGRAPPGSIFFAEQLGNAVRFQLTTAKEARTMVARVSKPSVVEGEVLPSDAPLLETPMGRENDFGAADENAPNVDETERPEVLSHPRSEV